LEDLLMTWTAALQAQKLKEEGAVEVLQIGDAPPAKERGLDKIRQARSKLPSQFPSQFSFSPRPGSRAVASKLKDSIA
jgi:hypothetical protein